MRDARKGGKDIINCNLCRRREGIQGPYLNRGSRAPPDLDAIHLQSSIIVLQEIQL